MAGDGAEEVRLGPQEQLLTPAEVAAMFRVNPKTVTRWARAGKLTAIRTLGGHRRFRASPAQVFRAWTEPEEIKAWFGLQKNDVTKAEIDLRVGGVYRLDPRTGARTRFSHDPDDPSRYGATITYDLKLDRKTRASSQDVAKVASMVGTARLDTAVATTASQGRP